MIGARWLLDAGDGPRMAGLAARACGWEAALVDIGGLLQELRDDVSVELGMGATAEQVAEAERALRVVFPASYRRFLIELGWASMDSGEVFGLGDDVPVHLQLVRVTQSERTEFRPHIPPHLVPLLNDGLGNHYCLDTSRLANLECPVVFWDHEHEFAEHQVPDDEAASFVDWLGSRLRDHRDDDN